MIFKETPIPGAFLVELELQSDERGWFARAFDRETFRERGLEPVVEQANFAYSRRAGTLRGMHWQAEPHGEPKLVRCTRGAAFDVMADVRSDSPAYCSWHGVELTEDRPVMAYVPPYVAHGYVSLVDDCEVMYLTGHRHTPEAECGVRWNDPAFSIEWPRFDSLILSEKDRAFPDFQR